MLSLKFCLDDEHILAKMAFAVKLQVQLFVFVVRFD